MVGAYLASERADAQKNEFVAGAVFARRNATFARGQLMSRFGAGLDAALENEPNVRCMFGMLLEAAKETYLYPDLIVVCGEPQFPDEMEDRITNPTVVVEVLSDSTEAWLRGGKFAQYQRVASLREYVLVSQDAIRVEWFTRESDGRWTYRVAAGPTGVVRLESLGVTLGLERIYRKVVLPAS